MNKIITQQIKKQFHQFLEQFHTSETIKRYLYTVDHFLSSNPNAIGYKYEDILKYLSILKKEYPNDTTRNTQLSAIKRFYDFLIYEGFIENHPCKNLFIRQQRKEIQTQNLFTPEELELLYQRENRYKLLDFRNKVLIGFLIYQGLRAEELCNITKNDVDLDEGILFVRRTKTTNKRILELKPRQIIHLVRYLESSRPKLVKLDTERLLLTKKGGALSIDGLNRVIRPLQTLFPVKNLNPQTIRQSVIYNWLNIKNIPLGDVQLMAGHRYPSSTEKYVSTDGDDKRTMINKFHPLTLGD